MDQVSAGYEQLEQRLVAWAQGEAGVRAAMIIGSRARRDHPADEWSDLDVFLFTADPNRYIASTEWIESIGEAELAFLERTPDGGGWERRVLFAGGLDVDFVILPLWALEGLAAGPLQPDVADILRRGVRVLEDKDGALAALSCLPVPEAAPYQPPSEVDFLNVIHNFWYHTVWTVKHLRRGEVWWAKSGCDMHLKGLLMQMLEWHARAVYGAGHDTWMRGRFLEEWADPRAVEELPGVFAHYDREDIGRALLVTMHLFGWVARETADRLGYAYSEGGERAATALVDQLLAPEQER
jgi:aminoglycoside 6-adenylyltransferase